MSTEAAALAAAVSGPTAVVRDGSRVIVASEPDEVIVATGEDAFRALDRLPAGFWCGWMTYNLGRVAEGLAPRSTAADLVLVRFATQLALDPRVTVIGPGANAPTLLDLEPNAASASTWRSSLDRPAWTNAIAAIHDYERAGDCYQVNLTRRLTREASVDPRALFSSLMRANPAPHAALIDARSIVGHAVVSASPEQFLSVDGRHVTTRPIKGTDADAHVLRASRKDAAENVMIVDLARNDLGRVCDYGSIRVSRMCELESHPGLHHLVSTIEGDLRADVGYGELFRATLPAASITGAPKPRVLQIIDELEPVDRGVYCGAIGWIDTERRRADWNVAIRTFEVATDALHFGVGAGITIDSDADLEWDETELKATRHLAAAAALIEAHA
jgi:para-aminobenzoate synthetase component 1